MTVDEEAFIRTPLSSNGFYRIGPDGKRRWEEFITVSMVGNENRWAAFTDDELGALAEGSDEFLMGADQAVAQDIFCRLTEEARAELERRRGDAAGSS